MKKTGVMILGLLFCVSMVFALKQDNPTGRLTTNKEQVLMAGKNVTVPQHMVDQLNIQPTAKYQADNVDGINQFKGQNGISDNRLTRDCPDGDFECWDLNHVGDDTQWYLGSGAAGDTMAVAFQGAVPCIVQEVYQKWMDGGPVTAWAAMVSDQAVAASNGTGATVNAAEGIELGRGDVPYSPIGSLLTNYTPNEIPGQVQDWTGILDIGGTFQVGDSTDLSDNPPFMIVFVKTAGEEPHPLAADVFTGMSYNWFGGPWCDPDGDISTPDGDYGDGYGWGNYQSNPIDGGLIDIAMLVKVTYPWGAPIAANPAPLCNTYATSDTRTVEVDLFDDDDEGIGVGIGGDDMVLFYWNIDGVFGGVLTLGDAEVLDVDAMGNGLYGFEIPYTAGVGSEITYWVESVDNMGLEATTAEVSFFILEPANPDADLLVVQDNDHTYYVGQYEDVLDDMGMVYEIWNVKNNVGIDYSVINYGWENILMFGWGNQSLPVVAGEIDPGYGDFLANGGDLLLADQDWFYGHSLDAFPNALTFGPGDPAYDWFSLAGGMNDPDDDGISANGGSGDTTITSLVEGLPDMILNNGPYGTQNWSDFLYPDFATPIYQGYDTEEIVGTLYEDSGTGSKRVCLTFTADAVGDTTELGEWYYHQEFADYVAYFIDLFNPDSPPQAIIVDAVEGIVFNDEGQEIFAEINDSNGDDFTADLWYTVDGGTPESVPMAATDRDLYSAIIPAQTGGDVIYWVTATDDDGSADSEQFTYFVYMPTSEVLFVLNNEMDPGAYPGLYYFYDTATEGLHVWPDFWVGGVIPELLGFYDIVFEVNTTGTWADLYDHYGYIEAWLAEGDKNYFVAGDEMFGMFTSWIDQDYVEGDFWYDMGVAHIYNDIGIGGISPIYAEEGNMLSGALYDGVTGMDAQLLYDPEYEIGITNYLDGFGATVDAVPFLWDVASDYPIGIYKEWDNGNKTVIMGADPLSINSEPYEWWGANVVGPTIMSYEWFIAEGCEVSVGDVDLSGSIDILDVVMLVGYILGTTELDECQMLNADANGDGGVDILDVVLIVNWILTVGPRADLATQASIIQSDEGATLEANGFVDGIQIELSHSEDFVIELGDALVAEFVTEGTTTNLIIIHPESSELFATSNEFVIESFVAVTTEGYIDAAINAPTEFSLNAAYPNPFNPVTTVEFAIPNASNVKVVIFDMLGRQVTELINNELSAGYYNVNWDATGEASGMYFITLITNDRTETQKVMLMK